jgi:ectoine hydroxylase-related dioxygenase (phytanoyl-CoA dioxygenase family)
MPKTLTPAEIEAYSARGYHFPLRACAAAEAEGLHERFAASERQLGFKFSTKRRENQRPHLLFPWLDALIRHEAILDAVEDVIGPDILCWGAGFFAKDAGDAGFVSWHQDATYWGLSSPDVVSAWLAFTPSTPESGCMRVVPGTHHRQLAHADTFADANLLSRGQEVAVKVDEDEAVDIVLQPGEFSLHHVLIVHGSEPNRADWPRIGLAMRFIPPHVRQIAGATDWATLVRGVDRHGNFKLTTPPRSDLHPDAVAHHAQVLDEQLPYLYRGAAQSGKMGPSPRAM